jgi:hypothetical protein
LTTPSTETPASPVLAQNSAMILGDCRDIAVLRVREKFTGMLDRVVDLLMERAGSTDVRDEQQNFLDAREMLRHSRGELLGDFERRLRRRIDDGIAGRKEVKTDYSRVDASKLTLVDTAAMDESVIIGNLTRIIGNFSQDELLELNRGIGHLLGRPDLETDDNPLGPATIVAAFVEALKAVHGELGHKFAVLRELNQASLGDIAAIYAEINKHLQNLRVVPSSRPSVVRRSSGGAAARAPGQGEQPAAKAGEHPAVPGSSEIDVMALYRRMYGGQARQAQPAFQPGGAELPAIDPAIAARFLPAGPLAPTPSGYVPGAPIISTAVLGEGLSRLQAGESVFDLVDGTSVQFSGIPEGQHNVLRDLQASALGKKVSQLESMTIELVAMLFDFIFETKDLPDGIKALLARLQIPVLKAAMLDSAFFAKKSHPSRLLVNALAEAGLGWSPVMGTTDPLYQKIEAIVHRVLDGFADDLSLFDELREDLEAFLDQEEKAAEANIQLTAEEINQRDRQHIASVVAKSEVERRIEGFPVQNFLAAFLRERWQGSLEQVYLQQGEESEPWRQGVATLDDLVWSVQPKRSNDERRRLVTLLPSLLKRVSAAMHGIAWPPDERERFMSNLVEAHAAAVKPSLAATALPTAAVAEQAKVEAEQAKAAGDEQKAARAEQLAEAMAQAAPAPEEPGVIEDEFLQIAQSLERGTWIEFEADDGQLAFAKLAWISPLRGTYLFTNRQGQRALSMTADELADRFRRDRARLVEAEPLIDRAFGSVMASFAPPADEHDIE